MTELRSKNKTIQLSKEEEKLSANLHFPYRRYMDRRLAMPRNIDVQHGIVIRGVHYERFYGYMFKSLEQFYSDTREEVAEALSAYYSKQKVAEAPMEVKEDINEISTEIDHGVRFLNTCSDENLTGVDKPMAWWHPDIVPVRTMPSDEDWNKINFVDFKLAPGVFQNTYALEAIDKFFNNEQPVKTLHVCNQIQSNRDNWIEENLSIWNDFIKHSYNATKKGYIQLEVFIYFNMSEIINPSEYMYLATDDDYHWATRLDPNVNKEHVKKVNFEFYDHIDYIHCITHEESIYFNLKNYHWPVNETGIYIENIRDT